MLSVVRRIALAAACLFAATACAINTQGTAAQNGSGGGGNAQGGSPTYDAAAGGAGAPQGGAAGVGSEKCLDRVDNDKNGLVDCADPACKSGFECDPAAPTGWQGYFRVHEQTNDTSATAPTACPDGSTPTRLFTHPAQAKCAPCACGALTGATCSPAKILCSPGQTNCSAPQDWTSVWQDGACHKNGDHNALSCSVEPSTVAKPGSCSPSGGGLTNPTHLFDGLVDVCGQVTPGGAGCGSGKACVARATGAYTGYLCVRQSGDQAACPSGWGLRLAAYQSGVDQRSCSACKCQPGGEKCTTGKYTFWDENDCTTCDVLCSGPIDVGASCTDVSSLLDNRTWSAKLTGPPTETGGSCAPSGGQPTGSIQGQGVVTFCCRN